MIELRKFLFFHLELSYGFVVEAVNRKVEYRIYPMGHRKEAMYDMLRLHQQLSNGALEHRIKAYRSHGVHISFAQQCKELTQLRSECLEYKGLNAQSAQVTLKRVDLGFQHFFRRVKSGEKKAGFPRFKSLDRFSGWGYKTHGDGWSFEFGKGLKNARLRISGIGYFTVRGKARNSGIPKTMEILHKQGRWYASVTFACTAQRSSGKEAIGLDWGVNTFATISHAEGPCTTILNPRLLRKNLKKLKSKQRRLAKKKRGSQNRKKARKSVAKLHREIANQRKDFLHQTTAKLVKTAGLIAIEELNIKNMTASGGSYKKGLNREILSTAPAEFHRMLKYKAEEAGVEWVEILTRKVKPSQTCHMCGCQEKKTLATRMHECHCGCVCGRDENAAIVILNSALFGNATGREPTRCGGEALVFPMKHETPATAPLAA